MKVVLLSFLIILYKCDDATVTINGKSCELSIRKLIDCEPNRTSKSSCEARGCCYKNFGDGSKEPWCSHPATTIPTTILQIIPTTIPEIPTTVPKIPTTVPKIPTTIPKILTTIPTTILTKIPTTIPNTMYNLDNFEKK